jgi:hypothetical protein
MAPAPIAAPRLLLPALTRTDSRVIFKQGNSEKQPFKRPQKHD